MIAKPAAPPYLQAGRIALVQSPSQRCGPDFGGDSKLPASAVRRQIPDYCDSKSVGQRKFICCSRVNLVPNLVPNLLLICKKFDCASTNEYHKDGQQLAVARSVGGLHGFPDAPLACIWRCCCAYPSRSILTRSAGSGKVLICPFMSPRWIFKASSTARLRMLKHQTES